jgi:hypothetical protein
VQAYPTISLFPKDAGFPIDCIWSQEGGDETLESFLEFLTKYSTAYQAAFPESSADRVTDEL